MDGYAAIYICLAGAEMIGKQHNNETSISYWKMAMNEIQDAMPKLVSYLVFKTVDSRDAVVKATGRYARRVLKAR